MIKKSYRIWMMFSSLGEDLLSLQVKGESRYLEQGEFI